MEDERNRQVDEKQCCRGESRPRDFARWILFGGSVARQPGDKDEYGDGNAMGSEALVKERDRGRVGIDREQPLCSLAARHVLRSTADTAGDVDLG